jgi:hypothetical protein
LKQVNIFHRKKYLAYKNSFKKQNVPRMKPNGNLNASNLKVRKRCNIRVHT